MMDVEYLDGIGGNTVEDLVGVAAERHHANARAAECAARARRPPRNVSNDSRMRCSTTGATVG
jgi:hypothetical protein